MSAGSAGPQLASERYGSAGIWSYRAEGAEIRRQRDGSGGHTGTGLRNLFKAFCSSLSGTLATQASLRGVGVGNQEATVAAATTTWILRDGTGMLGRILFAWSKGTKLDSEAKSWRLFADVLNDVAMFMEILAPFFPSFFLLIVCTAGVFKSIVGVAGGATRAALTVHQARRDNMADISAKDGSQETLVNLAGLLVSLLLIPLVTENALLTLFLFALFTVLHLVSNFKAVRAVVMETFNEARLDLVWRNFERNGEILTPRDANEREPVFNWFSGSVPIRLGVKLQELVRSPEEFERVARRGQERRFLIGVTNRCVCVCLLHGASVRDELKSMCQALSLRRLLTQRHTEPTNRHWDLVAQSEKLLEKHFDPFMKSLGETQWETSRNLLDWDEWRIHIKSKSN